MIGVLAAMLLTSSSLAAGDIDDCIQETLRLWEVPGCAVAVTEGDRVVLCKGYGVRKRSGEAVDSHTLFPLASVTKTLTAAAIEKLVEERICSYRDAVLKYFPGLALSLEYATANMTIGDCLSMNNGLAGVSTDVKYLPSLKFSEEELLSKELPKIPFPSGFRGMWSYQNYSYLLAAKVFERTKEKNWEEYIVSQILRPLKMDDTGVSFEAFTKKDNRAYPHCWIDQKWTEVGYQNFDSIGPAAGMYSSAHDMALWLANFSGKKVAPRAVATPEGFFPPMNLFLKDIFFPDCQFLTYGYGWFVHDYRGVEIYHTPGLVDCFTPVLAYIPSIDVGIAILPNVDSVAFTHALLYQLIDLYLLEYTDWNSRFLEIIKGNIN